MHFSSKFGNKRARKKELSLEQRAQIDILNAEGYTQQSIAKKLKISRCGVQYALQLKAKTGPNEDRKRSGRPMVTTKAEEKHLVVTSKRIECLPRPS